ncbi:MAG: PilZ domain-containing protein [Acidimicrobiia bacterium]|nr:PilZ domain-containing protein [Acidimicrobiia bacterium]
MSIRRDLRRHKREILEARVSLSWTDPLGVTRFALGRGLDISSSGMRLELDEPIPARTYVNFKLVGIRFEGSGSVRHCRRIGMRHQVGLEFTGGLQWRFTNLTAPSYELVQA